jgi:hypothetical protein
MEKKWILNVNFLEIKNGYKNCIFYMHRKPELNLHIIMRKNMHIFLFFMHKKLRLKCIKARQKYSYILQNLSINFVNILRAHLYAVYTKEWLILFNVQIIIMDDQRKNIRMRKSLILKIITMKNNPSASYFTRTLKHKNNSNIYTQEKYNYYKKLPYSHLFALYLEIKKN